LIAVGIIGLTTVKPLFMSDPNRAMGTGMMEMMMGAGMMRGMMNNMGEIRKKTEFSSNGERIFFTGVNAKGEAIKKRWMYPP